MPSSGMEEPRVTKVQTRGTRECPRRASASPEIKFLNPTTKLANTSVKMHACTHTRAYRQPHMYTHTQEIHTHIDIHAHTLPDTHRCTHRHTYRQTHVYTHTQAGTHTDTYMYTQIQICTHYVCTHRCTPLSCFSVLFCMCHHLTHRCFRYFSQTLVHTSWVHRLARALLL